MILPLGDHRIRPGLCLVVRVQLPIALFLYAKTSKELETIKWAGW